MSIVITYCKHRRREIIDGVEMDMCYAIGIERIGDMPCEYCVERENKEEKEDDEDE